MSHLSLHLQSNGNYTHLFGTILPFGALATFFIGYVTDRWGVKASMCCVCSCGTISDILRLAAPLAAQPVAFAAFALFRSCLFATAASYMAKNFGYDPPAALRVRCDVTPYVHSPRLWQVDNGLRTMACVCFADSTPWDPPLASPGASPPS